MQSCQKLFFTLMFFIIEKDCVYLYGRIAVIYWPLGHLKGILYYTTTGVESKSHLPLLPSPPPPTPPSPPPPPSHM